MTNMSFALTSLPALTMHFSSYTGEINDDLIPAPIIQGEASADGVR